MRFMTIALAIMITFPALASRQVHFSNDTFTQEKSQWSKIRIYVYKLILYQQNISNKKPILPQKNIRQNDRQEIILAEIQHLMSELREKEVKIPLHLRDINFFHREKKVINQQSDLEALEELQYSFLREE